MALLIREAPEGVVEVAAVLEDYIQLKWSRNFYTAGAFQMTINANQYNAQFIQLGDFIMPDEVPGQRDYIYMIEQIERVIDREGRASEFIQISGRSVGGMLEERVFIPPEGQAYDSRWGPAESLMKFWVTQQAGVTAPQARRIPRFYVDSDLGRGGDNPYKARYQTLATICEELGRAGASQFSGDVIGWEVYYEISNNTYRFDVIEGEDHTADSDNPVYFDIDFETALANRLLRQDIERKTLAIVGGTGELDERLVFEEYITDTEPTGFARKEVWIDAGNIDDEWNIRRKGITELEKTDNPDIIEVEVNTLGPFQFPRDWNLGDRITVRNKEWNLLVDTRIIGMTIEVVEGEGRPLITLQLGRPYPTIIGESQRKFFNDERRRV